MNLTRLVVLLTILLSVNTTMLHAQQATPPSCDTEQHKAFDFWLGEWEVYANDRLAGHNSISKAHNGCVIKEHWRSTGAFSGNSLNIYDRTSDHWHQTWVDSSGTLLQLDGHGGNGKMVLSGRQSSTDGNTVVYHKISWTQNQDGSVRQHWQTSNDRQTWTTAFDGLYKKRQTAAD